MRYGRQACQVKKLADGTEYNSNVNGSANKNYRIIEFLLKMFSPDMFQEQYGFNEIVLKKQFYATYVRQQTVY